MQGSDQAVFSYVVTSNDRLEIHWRNQLVVTIKGRKSIDLQNKLEVADCDEQQLILARATRNFKRGNEKRQARFNSDTG